MQQKRFMIQVGLVLAVLMLVAGLVAAQDPLAVGDSVNGTTEGADVVYELKLAEGDTVEISLTSNEFDPLITVTDADGAELGSDDDGGDGLNSLLSFTAPGAATYNVVVGSFFGEPTGAFTLSVSAAGSADVETSGGGESSASSADCPGEMELAFGCTLTVSGSADGTSRIVMTFQGIEGTTVNISATSLADEEEDGELVLFGPSNRELVRDDDNGGYPNPLIKRYILPETGEYTLELVEALDGTLSGSFNVMLEETEALELGEGELVVSMGEDVDFEVLTLAVERGVSYTMSIRTDRISTNTLFIDLLEEGQSFSDISMSVRGFSDANFTFEPQASGTVRIELDYFSFGNTVDFIFDVTAN